MVVSMFETAPQGIDPAELAKAEAAVRAYCGWHIAPVVTEALALDGNGGTRIVLPSLRVVSVDAVVVDGVTVTDPEWSASGVLHGRFSERPRSVEVVLTHGYETLPVELASVLLDMASGDTSGEAPIASKKLGDFQVNYATGADSLSGASVAASARTVLDRYRLPVLA